MRQTLRRLLAWLWRRYHLLDWVDPLAPRPAPPPRLVAHIQAGRGRPRRAGEHGPGVLRHFHRSWTEEVTAE